MSETALASSFRDPSGFVFERDGVVLRQVNESFREEYDALVSSGLYEALVGAGLLIPHEEVEVSHAPAPGAYKLLRPERIPFISYPYEWCFGELQAAADATLRAQQIALDHGMSLRDATAFNVQFRNGRPVLIDTLSFERLQEGRPWVAYRQFCQHFLAPLVLVAYGDIRLMKLSRLHVDGVPLDLASSLLPTRTRLRPGLLTHIHLHAKSQKRYSGQPEAGKSSTASVSLRALRGLVDSLRSTVNSLDWDPGTTTWSDYYTEGDSYTEEGLGHKVKLVEDFLAEANPAMVWDLGANTGRFSRLAAERGATTISFDFDEATVEANWRALQAEKPRQLLPLVLDLSNPSPRIGWASEERMSLADRGPADLVLALALVHHLAISNNVPLPRIAAYFAQLCRSLVIEFVPKSDPKVQILLASREDIFPDYTLEGFERAFSQRFDVVRREPILGSDRVLFLMRARA